MFVYFIEATDLDAVKIGIAADPEQRLGILQSCCPVELHILATAAGTPLFERYLHAKFAPQRIRGEWFKLSGPIADFIQGGIPSDLVTRFARLDKIDGTDITPGEVLHWMARRSIKGWDNPIARLIGAQPELAKAWRLDENGSVTQDQFEKIKAAHPHLYALALYDVMNCRLARAQDETSP